MLNKENDTNNVSDIDEELIYIARCFMDNDIVVPVPPRWWGPNTISTSYEPFWIVEYCKIAQKFLFHLFYEGSANVSPTASLSEAVAAYSLSNLLDAREIYPETGPTYISHLSCPDALMVVDRIIYVVSIARLYFPRRINRKQIRAIIDKKIRNMPRHMDAINWFRFNHVRYYVKYIALVVPSSEIAQYALEYIGTLNTEISFHVVICKNMNLYDLRPNIEICTLGGK